MPCNEDGTCERGTCEAGACVSPEMCSENTDCITGEYCDDGTCAEDPCDENTCGRGVCEPGSTDCIDPETCEADTDCLTNSLCVDGSCLAEEDFMLECDRGVPSFEEQACVNADPCMGDDSNCLEGNYCDAATDTCQANERDEDMVMCDRGVCARESGECISAEPCTAANECVDGEFCITDSCETELPGTCPGNQVREYDAENLQAVCDESDDGCATAVDCLGDRVCDAGACAEPGMCMPDAYEPNGLNDDPTDFLSEATANQLRNMTLCPEDVDTFAYALDRDPQESGLLLVDLQLAPSDVGLGTVTVRVKDPSGLSAMMERNNLDENGNPTDRIRIDDVVVGAMMTGSYTVEVEGEGVNTAGIEYFLTVDLLDGGVLTACEMPITLAPNTAVAGDFAQAPAQTLTSTCFDEAGQAGDLVYQLDLQERSFVTLLAQGSADVALSVRQTCTTDISEYPAACSSEVGAGQAESLGVALDAGTHFIVTQNQGGDGSTFSLSNTAQTITCDPAATTQCLDADVSRQCNDTLTGVREVTCDTKCV